jgi:thioredoxin reductase
MAATTARMALRAGASDVSLLFKRDRRNPTAEPEGIGLAEGEGVRIHLGTRPSELKGQGVLQSVRCQSQDGELELELEAALFIDAEKRDCDLGWLDIPLTDKGLLETDQSGMSGMPGVFGAGETVTGPRNLIRAVASGKQAAEQVEQYLEGGPR